MRFLTSSLALSIIVATLYGVLYASLNVAALYPLWEVNRALLLEANLGSL